MSIAIRECSGKIRSNGLKRSLTNLFSAGDTPKGAEDKGYTGTTFFADDGSAEAAMKRPEFQKMLTAIEVGCTAECLQSAVILRFRQSFAILILYKC